MFFIAVIKEDNPFFRVGDKCSSSPIFSKKSMLISKISLGVLSEKTLSINSSAPMHICNQFLGIMIKNNDGHICNIASSASLVSNPKMSVYAASKWAIFAWSDSLRLEMKQLKKDIKITTILPYYINTGMFDGVKSRIPILEAEAAALTIIKAIEKNKKIISIPGWIYRFTRFGQALMSVNMFDWFAGSIMGIYKTMNDFKGRK